MGFWPRISAAVFLFLLILAGLFWAQISSVQNRVPLADGTMELLGASATDRLPEPLLNAAMNRLADAPNDQRTFNLLYVDTMRSDAAKAEKDKVGNLLSRLGWRYSAAQQNLIASAIVQRDFETIVKSADSLLRREQTPNEILELLHLVEVEPETQPVLVKQLESNPIWKKAFLTRPESLKTQAQVEARGKTLKLMLEADHELDRSDLAPSLNVMANAREFEAAYDIYRTIQKTEKNGVLNDPYFIQLAESANALEYRPYPFEWTKHSKRGMQVDSIESIGKVEVRIRWDGRGTPLVLSQFLNTSIGSKYRVELAGLDATVKLAKQLQFALLCPEGYTRFEDAQEDPESNKLILRSTDVAMCRFPRFDIRGRIQDVSRPQEISLSSINLYPDN